MTVMEFPETSRYHCTQLKRRLAFHSQAKCVTEKDRAQPRRANAEKISYLVEVKVTIMIYAMIVKVAMKAKIN